jgi:hypothetical protein
VGKRACEVLQDGLRRSETIRRLVSRVERSDLIVWVTLSPLPPGRTGATRLLTASAGYRFLLVTLDPQGSPFLLAARLGHELQHVTEIADAAEVHDSNGMSALYRKIGWPASGSNTWETEAALELGQRVFREMSAPVAALANPGAAQAGKPALNRR